VKVARFEELAVWKKSKELSLGIYRVTNQGVFRADFGLRDQIRRASVSVMSKSPKGSNDTAATSFASSSQLREDRLPRSEASCTSRASSAI
jgi:hypothetical protein